MNVDVLPNSRLQLFHTSKDAAANALVGDLGEPAFDQIQPRSVSGGEVDMEARSFGKPVPDGRCLVSSVVVHHDMNIEFGGHVRFNGVEKSAELLRAMAAMQLPDYPTSLQLQCGEQRSGAVAFVIVGTPLDLTRA